MACYIVGAGDFDRDRFTPSPGDYIIAADGGYRHLSDAGISPDLVLGDFDSLDMIPLHHKLMKYP
ncbi:MAG: thiamine diphosphokinase, partial [Clostridia bacterium]|nr:thiamine diphosphokinase [Clostridia bacterium]